MEETHSDVLKDFGSQTEAILKILIVDNSFLKNWKKIVDYLESYTNLTLQLLNEGDLKNAAQVLAKLQNICNEVLKSFPGDVDPERKLSTFFNTKEQTHDREIKLNTGGYIELLQSFISLKDITEIKIPSSFAYYLVLEYFLQITNNIAYISFKRNKIDKALDFLMKVLDCLGLMRFCSYYIKYHLSTVLLNLIFLLDDSHLQDSNQLLINIILLLEKIETEIDKSKNREPVYTYISERAFCFSFMLEPKNQNLQEKEYKNIKSFLIARMCISYEYYSEILQQLRQPNESQVARKQAEYMEKVLDKMEISLLPPKSDNNLTTENLERVEGKKRENSRTVDSDIQSSNSFNTAGTGFTGASTFEAVARINKENVIFQKYVEVNDVKFKILMAHLRDLQCLEILVYSKERNLLKKVFIHFQEIINYAKRLDIEFKEEKDVNKILTKIARMLYFKEGELYMKEIPYFRGLEELKRLENL